MLSNAFQVLESNFRESEKIATNSSYLEISVSLCRTPHILLIRNIEMFLSMGLAWAQRQWSNLDFLHFCLSFLMQFQLRNYNKKYIKMSKIWGIILLCSNIQSFKLWWCESKNYKSDFSRKIPFFQFLWRHIKDSWWRISAFLGSKVQLGAGCTGEKFMICLNVLGFGLQSSILKNGKMWFTGIQKTCEINE